jgi:hypothetical protein
MDVASMKEEYGYNNLQIGFKYKENWSVKIN